MSGTLSKLKSDWILLAQAAVWLLGLITLFVVSPPRLWPGAAQFEYTYFAQFLVTLILAAFWVYSSTLEKQKSARALMILAFAFAIVGSASLFSYMIVSASWTCQYDGRGLMVIGETFTEAEAIYAKANDEISCRTLIQDFTGVTKELWNATEITNRYYILVLWFTASILLFAVSIVVTLEAIRSANHFNDAAK